MRSPALPTLKLYFTPLHFILQSPDTGPEAQLILERTTGRCYCSENFNPLENGGKESELYYLDIFLILGIIVIDSVLYLCVVTDADIIGSLAKANIYHIRGIKLLTFVHNSWEPDCAVLDKEELERLFNTGFYFSYYYDLTRSMQRAKMDENLHDRADKSFYWNFELYSELLMQSIDTQWFVPVVQGFVGIEKVEFDGHDATVALISRRSCDRTGTRYNCRGVDDEGNVANFVETEQILTYGGKMYSFVQIRGSVPVYWEQTGIIASLALTQAQEVSSLAFKHHVNKMLHKYYHMTMINLLQDTKAHEKLLTQEFESVFKQTRHHYNSKLVYQYFDFHHSCKGGKYTSVLDLIKSLQEYFSFYKFYCQSSTRVESTQRGVMRTNCLDCLDRTNVVQCYVSWAVLSSILGLKANMDLESEALAKVFKNQWADNGDLLSLQYTGTSSTISAITRGEKQGLRTLISQSLKSIGRFYNANLIDAAKQKSIDAVLRRRKDSTQLSRVEADIWSRENECFRVYTHRVRCVTWNLAGQKIENDFDFGRVIGNKEQVDLIFVSVQEMVELSANNILREGNNAKRLAAVRDSVKRHLEDGFFCVLEHSLVGVALLVFARSALNGLVGQVNCDHIRLGMGGKTGNKGAVVGRFNLQSTSICVISAHLASGQNSSDLRKSQIRDIQADIFVKDNPDRRQMQIFEHDYKFLMGDLNFRIDLSLNEVLSHISESKYSALYQNDQLAQALNEGSLPGYQEGCIDFAPTYKYSKSSGLYNTSRVPAWCDRVLFSGPQELISYHSVDIKGSDHRPVVCNFLIKSKELDQSRRQELRDELFKELGEEDLV